MGSLEALIIGYIVGVLTTALGLFIAIIIFLTGGNGELGDFVQGLFDFTLSYFNPNPNAFLIGFLLGVLSAAGGGASAKN